jgi:hypothetical protein
MEGYGHTSLPGAAEEDFKNIGMETSTSLGATGRKSGKKGYGH